jgi:hypothetical protein
LSLFLFLFFSQLKVQEFIHPLKVKQLFEFIESPAGIMILSSFLLLILGAMFVTAKEQKVAQRIPRELSTRDIILSGGGWGLKLYTCPIGSDQYSNTGGGCCHEERFFFNF